MDRSSTESPEVRDRIVECLDALPRAEEVAAAVKAERGLAPTVSAVEDNISGKTETKRRDEALRGAVELCSGDPERVRYALLAQRPLSATFASLAVILLADEDLHVDAIRALRMDATKIEGQLMDALLNPDEAFEIRRRVPRVLSECRTQLAVDGLLRGAEDARFEVRYACARALLKITSAHASFAVTLESVVALVGREVGLSKEIWESQGSSAVDDAEYETPALFERLLRDRVDRSLEHVFNLLALSLDRESLQIAFSALHMEDAVIRGTALEYLENVLPDEVRDLLWPFLGEERPMRTARSAAEILADLVRSSRRRSGAAGSRPMGLRGVAP
jgi:HEAT repeat protein